MPKPSRITVLSGAASAPAFCAASSAFRIFMPAVATVLNWWRDMS